MNGAEVVLSCLRAEGIKYIFGNPGTTETPLLDALSDTHDITYLLTLHENVAMGMADGYARSGGRVGLVNVHTGAGTANAIGGICSAFIDKTPIVITAGYKDTRILGRECYMEIPDFPGMSRQFTKWSWEVLRTDRIGEELLRGLTMAVTPPCGPVFISLCEDLLRQETNPLELVSLSPKTSLAFTGDEEGIKKAAHLLINARSPLFLAGSEIAKSNALYNAVELAELLSITVMTDCRDALCSLNFPHTHPYFRGMFDPSSPYVKNADIILGIGCKMFVDAAFSPEPAIPKAAKIIHFHSDPHEIARLYPEEISVITDAKKGIDSLIQTLKTLLTRDIKAEIQNKKKILVRERAEEEEKKQEEVKSGRDKKPIQLPFLVAELCQTLDRDAIIVDEAISSSRPLLKFYPFETPGTYHRSASGILGWGVPAALGVKLANPQRQVIAFVGDGSFLFSVQSLWTAARYNIPVVIIICNNRQYKVVKDASVNYQGISVRTGTFIATDITCPDIDFCKVAEGFGVHAIRITDPQKIKFTLNKALRLGKPAVLDVRLA